MKQWKRILLCLGGLIVAIVHASPLVEHQPSCRRYTTQDGLPQMQVETVWQDSRGYIYVGTLSGFVRYDGLEFQPFMKGRRENIVGFAEVNGQVRALGFCHQWLVEDNEVVRMPMDSQGEWMLNNFNSADMPAGMVLMEDRQERNRRICLMRPDGMKPVLKGALLDEMTPDRKLYRDRGAWYVPTMRGLYKIEDGKGVRKARRISDKGNVYSLLRQEGTLYALAGDGIYTVGEEGLKLRTAYAFEAPDYGLFVRLNGQGQWMIADSHTIYLYDGERVRPWMSGFNLIKGMLVDKWNRLWVATYEGVFCFFHGDFVNYRLTDKNDIVRALAVGEDGRMVAGTLNGTLLTMGTDGEEVEVVGQDEGNFYAPSAACVGGEVYLPGNGDVVCYDGERMCWLGLPHDRYYFVTKLGGRLLVGSRTCLSCYDPATGGLDTLSTDVPSAFCATEDGEHRLWVGSIKGLFCVADSVWRLDYPQQLVVTAMTSSGEGKVFFASADSLFTVEDGKVVDLTWRLPVLAGHEIRAIHVSKRGYLVVAVIDGLVVARMDENGDISDVHFFDHTNGFTLIEPQMAQMAETEEGVLWLAGLDGMTSFDPARLLEDNGESTVVEAPLEWWQHGWVWAVGVVVMALMVWLLAWVYEKRRNRIQMMRLRREMHLKDLQINAIRLKAIPHFHSNVLACIEYLMTNRQEEATQYLKLYADFTNQMLTDLECPAQTVAEEVDFVRTYLRLEGLRYGERLQFSIRLDDDVDNRVMLPTMLLYTYCQNAVKHGISGKKEGGKVEVRIRRRVVDGCPCVVVAVKDDGIGRVEAAKMNVNSTKQGLRILLEQIGLYNQVNRHPIRQQVTDLYDGEGKAAGTCYEMTVPMEYEYELKK